MVYSRSGQYVVSGSDDSTISVWDTTASTSNDNESTEPILKPLVTYIAHGDCVNGVR